jgi:hypothetical protein
MGVLISSPTRESYRRRTGITFGVHDDVAAVHGVFPHLDCFFRGQHAGLVEEPVGHANLADGAAARGSRAVRCARA